MHDLADSKAYRYAHHQIELPDAVDELQRLAERTGLTADQDLVQNVIAGPFAWVRGHLQDNAAQDCDLPEPHGENLPPDYASQLVKRFELDDPRDAWKHTGELPPTADFRNGPIGPERAGKPHSYKPADSTVDAFLNLVRLGDRERLRIWLDDHRRDAPYLLEYLRAV
ncbi:hypothetical protein XH86_18555 [Bradyrhizobium guangdongense]|uniref:Uncharacterized protein n=1 Tax=Bradyrhizobium guangdongense TaxID=1325090 RepID=A0ABX6UR52_9BRAD|nr:hypothetical protein X265_18550 [Bradyrhizobium guangdongense]QOZ63840.1 hypothetical protein XH86_18555 [Bradyrhizobium guangdongense]